MKKLIQMLLDPIEVVHVLHSNFYFYCGFSILLLQLAEVELIVFSVRPFNL